MVCGWAANYRFVIERDGLISFQVTVHGTGCDTCEERIKFIQQQVEERNVQCFWNFENPNYFINFRPPNRHLSIEESLLHTLGLRVALIDPSAEQWHRVGARNPNKNEKPNYMIRNKSLLGGFWLLPPWDCPHVNESHPMDHDSISSGQTNSKRFDPKLIPL